MKNKILNLLLIAGVVTFTACNEDETPEPTTNNTVETNTIIDVTTENGFTILGQALTRVDLVDVLEGEGPFTVFAPTDSAFQALLTELNLTSLDEVSDDDLKQILLNHVVSGKVMSTDLTAGYVNTLSDGPEETKLSLLVDLTDGVMLNNRSKVTQADVAADNGVIHVIDRVITRPSVVDAALDNPNFSILVAALTRDDLTTDFVATLSAEGPYTVFAPTNKAFEDLLAGNDDWDELADIPVAVLEAVLKYHVVAGTNVQSTEITDGMMPETFEGSTVTINNTNGVVLTDQNGGTATVQIADVQTSNGVIHAISAVILPKL